jgi:hypothetical protein
LWMDGGFSFLCHSLTLRQAVSLGLGEDFPMVLSLP